MTRVLIERWLRVGEEERFRKILAELRKEAAREPGYVSAESLRDVRDPQHVVILSSWRSAQDWDAWEVSDRREAALAKISALLSKPEQVTVLEPA